MPIAVKICGLSTAAAVEAAVAGGARWVGFNFYPPSPRAVTPQQAAAPCALVPSGRADDRRSTPWSMHRGNPHDRNPGSAGPPNIKQALRFLQPIGLDVGSPQRGLTSHTTRWARNRLAHSAPVRSWPFVAADLAKLHGPRPSQVVVRCTLLSREPSSQKTLRWREMDSNFRFRGNRHRKRSDTPRSSGRGRPPRIEHGMAGKYGRC